MGSDASVPQEEPLISEQQRSSTLPNGTEPPQKPQSAEPTGQPAVDTLKPESSKSESKSAAATTEHESRSTEMKESAVSTNPNSSETSSNPYVDDNLVEAQKEYNPEKNEQFEQQHRVPPQSTTAPRDLLQSLCRRQFGRSPEGV